MKLCKDCKHAKKDHSLLLLGHRYKFAKCHHEAAVTEVGKEFLPVTGEVGKPSYFHCTVMRMTHGRCGLEGKLWEASNG